jgi:proprotein convertase subtilisin/kexin type 5
LSGYCTSPCQRCSTSPSSCLSCLPSPNTLIMYYTANSSCLSSCPNATYQLNNTCVSCVSPCLLCSNATVCISCNSSFIFLSTNSSCLSPCPNGYFNASGNCSLCQSPCGNCTNLTVCLSCTINFFYNFSCIAASLCPNGTYANSTTRLCANCSV